MTEATLSLDEFLKGILEGSEALLKGLEMVVSKVDELEVKVEGLRGDLEKATQDLKSLQVAKDGVMAVVDPKMRIRLERGQRPKEKKISEVALADLRGPFFDRKGRNPIPLERVEKWVLVTRGYTPNNLDEAYTISSWQDRYILGLSYAAWCKVDGEWHRTYGKAGPKPSNVKEFLEE